MQDQRMFAILWKTFSLLLDIRLAASYESSGIKTPARKVTSLLQQLKLYCRNP